MFSLTAAVRQLEEVQELKIYIYIYFVSQHLCMSEMIGLTDAKVTAAYLGKGTCKGHDCLQSPGSVLMSEDPPVHV